ncbi:MAG TPA: endonuclease/exonuclease/phosphatase family protein [Thermoleophilia bacterium]|nr:endonuclease/exonuclease/phosphatase family protein [Thermoleophilia bacterium]
MTIRALWLAGAVLPLASGGCGAATNYLDSSGPMFETLYATPPAAPVAGPLRVVTFNIEYAIHVDRAIEVLSGTPALQGFDLLALQEMDDPGVEKIARALKLNSVYAPGGIHPTSGRDFGCALLSPWPLVEPRKVLLPHGARGTGLRRAAIGATLVRAGRRLRVYSVHLPAPLGVSGSGRHDQVTTLLADAADSPDPVVIAGDLNSHGLGKRFVEGGYAWITEDVGWTASEKGVLHLAYDHVFTRGLRAATPGPATGVVSDNRKASDHRPVWALLDPAGS